MWRDLERICESLAVPFRRPSVFPRNSVLAARIVTQYNGTAWIPAFVQAVYQANFVADRNIADQAVIADCLRKIDIDFAPAISTVVNRDSKARFRAQTERAVQQNIFGAPSFVSNGELFWGNDRLEPVVQWQAQHRTTIQTKMGQL